MQQDEETQLNETVLTTRLPNVTWEQAALWRWIFNGKELNVTPASQEHCSQGQQQRSFCCVMYSRKTDVCQWVVTPKLPHPEGWSEPPSNTRFLEPNWVHEPNRTLIRSGHSQNQVAWLYPQYWDNQVPPLVDKIVRRCNSLFGHVARLGDDTPAYQAIQYLETSSRSPKKQVTGSDSPWQQSPFTRWSVDMRRSLRSFQADATVPADYVITKTTWSWPTDRAVESTEHL